MKKLFSVVVIFLFLNSINVFANDLFIFGGSSHDVFLGCITCDENSSSSIFNDKSKYGLGNSYGVWSSYSGYKNTYSSTSMCNEYASYPPIVVDKKGNYYGKLSLKEYDRDGVCYHSNKSKELCRLLKLMCLGD